MQVFWVLILLVFSRSTWAQEASCKWCVASDAAITSKALALAQMKPAEFLSAVEAEKICVKVLESQRPLPQGLFHWGQVRASSGSLEQVTQTQALMGKTLCADELPIAKGCRTILLAADAPKSTLVHEYLHIKQIEKDSSWCPISKRAWTEKKLAIADYQRMLNQEWDVHVWLWEHLEQMNLALEDKVGVASNLMEYAVKRKDYDPAAFPYVEKQGVQSKLNGWVDIYRKQLGLESSRKGDRVTVHQNQPLTAQQAEALAIKLVNEELRKNPPKGLDGKPMTHLAVKAPFPGQRRRQNGKERWHFGVVPTAGLKAIAAFDLDGRNVEIETGWSSK